MSGKLPDRPPLYDVIRNDAILEHFGKNKLVPETAQQTVIDAHSAALDATKGFYKLPEFRAGQTLVNDGGRKVAMQRWTSWTDHLVYQSTEDYVKERSALVAEPWDWSVTDEETRKSSRETWLKLERMSGDIVRDFGLPGPLTLDGLFAEVGLEAFSYFMADCPEIVHRQVEFRFAKINQALEQENLPDTVLGVSEACDMAYKTGLIFSPSFLRDTFIPGYTRLCNAAHKRGHKVLFHSDGDLMEILDDLVEAGIDLMHPVEPLAGMDPGEIHRRYPDLILCGTIDVSQLLPFGTPQQVADQVTRNIEATEGKIMLGSSTEVNNEVPLENYLALRDTALNYRY